MPEPNRFYFETAMTQRLDRLAGVDVKQENPTGIRLRRWGFFMFFCL